MIARRALLGPLILFAAVLGQLVVINRLPLPGGGLPDLVLLVVTALGVTAGPTTGLLAGFAGGLAIDVAPPGGHLAGEYALVYCLAGYACGQIRDLAQGASAERSTVTSLTVMAAGVTAGEAGKAGLSMMLSDPNVTGPVVRHVLPAAVLYDLLLCPFVLWLVSAAVPAPAAERAPAPQFLGASRLAPAFRLASVGAVPRLRLTGSTPPLVPPPVRAEPRLRLAAGRSSSPLSGTSSAFSTAPPALAGGRATKLNFASSGRGNQLGSGSALRTPPSQPGRSPAKGWLRADKPAPAGWQPRSPGKGWARGDSPAAVTGRPAAAPGKGWVRTGSLASTTWRRRSPGSGWLRAETPAGAPPAGLARGAVPGKGWLRPAAPPQLPVPKSPGRGWLRPAPPPSVPRRKSPGRGWLRPAKPPRLNWYTRSPSTRWLRRGRRRRLLIGGRR